MNKPITDCEGCVFVVKEDGQPQKGCDLQRPILLGVASEEEYYVLDRFCNAHRPPEWLSNLGFEDQLSPADAVLNEVRPRLGFFIVLDTSSKDAIADLTTTVDSIENMDDDHSYIVVITDKVEYNEEIWAILDPLKAKANDSQKYVIMQLTESPEQMHKVVDQAFTHAQNGWVMCLGSGETVNPSSVEALHNFMNIEMRQLVLIEPSSGISGLAFPAYLFKFLNGNRTKIFNDDMTDSRDFMEKVKDAEVRGGTKTIFTWPDLLNRLEHES